MQFRSKTIFTGVIWSLVDTIANFALKFFFALAITRMLSPRDYGLVAYTGLFLGIASWLSEGGFGLALIQKKDPVESDYSTGYFFNVIISILFCIAYFVMAPWLASYFGEPELENIMKVMSTTLVLNSLCYIHLIKLIKHIQFKQQALLNFFASVISGTIGLLMAYYGYGYWALIFQTLSGAILKMAGLWAVVRWRPVFVFSWGSFKEQFKFGSKVFFQGLFESIFREINSLVVGKSYHTSALGNYSRGQKFYDLFIIQTGTAFNKVLYPAMAKEADKAELQKKIYVKVYNLLFFIMAPLSVFLFLLAEPLIQVLLTQKWHDSVPYMQLFFIAGFIATLMSFNSSTMLSSNRPNIFLVMDIIHKSLMAIALFLTFKIGIKTIIVGWLVVNYVFYVIYEWMMFKLGYYEKGKYIKMLQVLLGLLPGIAFYYLLQNFVSDQLYTLLLNIIIQPVIYFSVMRLSGASVYKDFSLLIKPMLPAKIRFVI
ncbi:MAG: lipopolysaccharide biosynthesis protein [Sphingobacteriales bacterium]|nr:lipopolysaccharide biosynthesis protein [Sphingobacteriales bacterium]